MMPRPDAGELAQHLARQAEAVCRRYLCNGRRHGRYWLVGDVRNTPGRSLYVRLNGPDHGKGAAGKWTDAATGEHGDLLDVIRNTLGLPELTDAMAEAQSFLGLPPGNTHVWPRSHPPPVRSGSPDAARRLFAISQPIAGTLAETYLRSRGCTALPRTGPLRSHRSCHYRATDNMPPETWPAMIAAVTDHNGRITGVQRTWLARDGSAKAPLDTPRRAMGDLLGHAVRFGSVDDVLAAGEGVETMLSLRCILPSLPVAAALSAAHLAALLFPVTLRRLYIARDNDPAGHGAAADLADRAQAAGIEAITLAPQLKDFNDDLRMLGTQELRAALRLEIAPEDVARFLPVRA